MYILMNMHTFVSILSDTDECIDGTHNCSQICTNTKGSFICGCNSGFLLDADGATCNGMHIYYLHANIIHTSEQGSK